MLLTLETVHVGMLLQWTGRRSSVWRVVRIHHSDGPPSVTVRLVRGSDGTLPPQPLRLECQEEVGSTFLDDSRWIPYEDPFLTFVKDTLREANQ